MSVTKRSRGSGSDFMLPEQVVANAITKVFEPSEAPAFVVPLCRIREWIQARSDDGLFELIELILMVAALRFAEFSGSGFNHRGGGSVIAEVEVGETTVCSTSGRGRRNALRQP